MGKTVFGLKCPVGLTDLDQIWTTHRPLGGTKAHRILLFLRVGNSPKSIIFFQFSSNLRKNFLSKISRAVFTEFSGFLGAGIPAKQNPKIGGQLPIWARGGANFSIGPLGAPCGEIVLSRPVAIPSHISQWARLKYLPAVGQNPLNICGRD